MRILFLLVMPLTLSSCCLFGYHTTSVTEWESRIPGDTEQIMIACEAKAEAQAARNEEGFRESVLAECAREAPFSTWQFVRRSGRELADPELAKAAAREMCLRSEDGQPSLNDDGVKRYCRNCYGHL